jgi:hypothetical protein
MSKNHRIEVRLSEIDKSILQKKAEETGISLSQYVLSCALKLEIKNRLTADEIECYKTLSKYADNFRRISNLFKLGDTDEFKKECLVASAEIRQHLLKLK